MIVFEPFYENYGPDAILCDAKPVFVPLLPGQPLDLDRLARVFSNRTRAIVVNTPGNPSGRVLTRAELERHRRALPAARRLGRDRRDLRAHPLQRRAHPDGHAARHAGAHHHHLGASKTFSITGWRIGTIVAPAEVTDAIRKVHDFLTVGAPAPLMEGLAVAMEVLGRDYYENLAGEYRARREIMMGALVKAGFKCVAPDGAYYILADFSGISDLPAPEFARWLTIEGGIATVPGTSFWSNPKDGTRYTRFAFCKTHDLLEAAVQRLETLPRSGGR